MTGVDPPLANDATPAFAIMDNTGDKSEIQFDLTAGFLSNDGANAQLLRPRLLAQYVAPSGFGGYASFGAAAASGTGTDSTFKLGSLEFGGLYQHRLGPELEFAARGALAIHTSDGDYVNAIALALSRPADMASGGIGDWLRFGASPTVHIGGFFMRVDAGIDVRLDDEGSHPFGHVNAGAGIGNAAWTAAAEFSTMFAINSDTGGGGSFKVVGLSTRFNAGSFSPFFGISHPFDLDGLGTVVNVMAGVNVPLKI